MNNKVIEESITKALYKLIDEKQIDKITITELVKKAGVSRISFYRHYDSILDVLKKELDKMTDSYINNYFKEIDINNIEYDLLNLFEVVYEHKELVTSVYKANSQFLIQQQLHKVLDKKIDKYNIYKRSFYTGGIYNTLLLWIGTGLKEKPKFLVNNIMEIIKTRSS